MNLLFKYSHKEKEQKDIAITVHTEILSCIAEHRPRQVSQVVGHWGHQQSL